MARLELIVDPAKAKQGFREADQASDKYRRGAKQATDQTGKVQGAFRKLSSAAFSLKGAIAGLGIGVAVTQMSRYTTQSIAATAAISEQADVAGIGAERFQELTKAFADLGGVQESVTSGALRRFNRRFGLAQEGMGAANKTLDRLNINLNQGTGPALEEAIQKLARMEDGANRTAEASQLFGEDAGPRLAAVLAQGTGAIDDQIEKLRDQGRIIDDELVEDARKANDVLGELSDTVSAEFNRRVARNAEEITTLAESVTNLGFSVLGYGADIVGFFSDLGNEITESQETARYEQSLRAINSQIERITENQQERVKTEKALREAQEAGRLGEVEQFYGTTLEEVERQQDRAENRLDALRRQREILRDQGPLSMDQPINMGDVLKEVNAQLDFLEGFSESASGSLTDLQKAFGGSAEQAKALHKEAGKLVGLQSEFDSMFSGFLRDRAESDVTSMEGAFGSLGEDEETEAMRNASRMMDRLDRQMNETNDAARDFGMTFSSALEDAVVEGENAREVMQGLFEDITRIMFRQSVTSPLKEGIANFDWSSLTTSANDSMASGTGSSPAAASDGGDTNWGATLVNAFGSMFSNSFAGGGDTGPGPRSGGLDGRGGFPAMLHPRETVIDRTKGQPRGGDTYHIDARGADQAAVARLERTIKAVNGSIERRAVSAVGSQRQRSFRG